MSLALRSLGPVPTNNTHALIAITAWSDNVTIYYDHWENGINFDPDNPAATADETFTLATTGTILTLDNTPVGGIPIPRNPANTYYDGGDRIYVAGGAVTVARVSWLEARGRAIQSVAWEIYPVKPQLTTYVLPFGENLSASFPDFLRTYVVVQATADNTTFTVDLDGNGTPDPLDQNFDGDTLDAGDTTVVTLQAGESFFLGNVPVNPVPMPRGALATINSGAIIQGSSTLQVKFIVGDQLANFETRGLSAFPRGYWTNEYYAPVGDSTAKITDIFLYNPNAAAITVNWETLAGSGNFVIGAGATVSYVALAGQLPIGGGVYLRGSDDFWGVSTIDSTGQVNEWAYSLLPSTLLYNEHFLGWAPGGADGNDSGVFLTVVQDNTRVFVDTNNDGIADQIYTLNRLQTQYITDPIDGDLSGARFWATGQFSMAFGQNPDTAPGSATSGDLGYVSIPSADFISLVLTVDKSVSPQVVPTASGSTATFTLTVNSEKYTVDGIKVMDMLPADWQYLGPTSITLPNMTTVTTAPTVTAAGAALPAPFVGNCPAGGGDCLTWDNSVLGNMAENQQITITFTARTTALLAAGTLSQNRVKAIGNRTFGSPSQTQTFEATNFAYVASGALQITKTSGAANPVSPGNTVPYTVTVTNPAGSPTQTGLSLYDALPSGVTYVAGTTSLSRSSVADSFGTVAYTNDNGTRNWVAAWVDSQGDGAGAGDIVIANGELQLDNSNSNEYTVLRRVDLTGATSAVLSFGYRTGTGVDAGDTIYIQARRISTAGWTTVGTFTGITGATAGTFSIDLASFPALLPFTTTAEVRFSFANNNYAGANEFFYVDNLSITYNISVTVGIPPDLLSSGALYTLLAGQNLTTTFSVTVDDPFPTGQTSILNTASTSSVQMPIAISASATNTVLVPSSLSASAGGRVWLDADFDGVQDIGEPGMPNIEVTLKDRFGTPVATTITDGNGRYLFTSTTPETGYYVEVTGGLSAGLSQTFPVPPGLNRTTSFDLVDGQVYTSADLGYRASAGTASFGDLVWVDADADNIRDAGEIGLGGVTVTLYRDANGNGLLDIGTDTLVSTTTSVPGGTYLFTGASASGTETYFVSATTPSGYLTTGFTTYKFTNVAAGNTLLTADFGFNSTTTTYTIKDRVWTDTDGDGVFDAGETGIAGVTIELLDASLNVIGTTSTASDGTFTFSGLAGGGADYTVRINDTGGVLLDYYGTTTYSLALKRAESNIIASVDRVATPPPSYGFRPLRSIGDTIFNDLVGVGTDGVQNAVEAGIAGVVVSLYRNNAPLGTFDGSDTLLSTVTTDAAGQYLFSGLADGEYIVSVPVPAGYSFIPNGVVNPDLDSNPANGIQNRATMVGGVNVLDKDFGFRAPTSRTVSGTIWDDLDADGVIDAGESLLANVTLEVRRNCPSPCTLVSTVTTNASGAYSVAGLVNDNSYTVFVTDTNSVLTNYNPTFEYGVGTAGPFDNQAPANLTSGDVSDVNFGFKKPKPTLVTLSSFSAYDDGGRFAVRWSTSSETDTAGFYLFRLDEKTGRYRQINRNLLPALLTSQQGGTYSLIDTGASLTKSNTYILVEIEGKGAKNTYGPFTVRADGRNIAEGSSNLSPKAPGLLLNNTALAKPNSPVGPQANTIKKYVDRTGTIVVTNSNTKSSGGHENAVADEISNFIRKASPVSDGKKAQIEAQRAALKKVLVLRKQRQGGMIKISISNEGLYYMDSQEISSLLGISQNEVKHLIKTGNLAISSQGKAVAYVPASSNTGIFFYAQGIDSIYTKENVYWIYRGQGLQMGIQNGKRPAVLRLRTSAETVFLETVHEEEDKIVVPVLTKDPESDYWFWDYIVSGDPSLGRKTFTVQAYGAANVSSAAAMTVTLHGLTDTGVAHDHHVIISLNGTVIGEDRWKGAEERVITLNFSQGLLYNGTNTLEVKGLLDTGAPYSVFYIDSFDLTYERLYEAQNNSLTFTAGDTRSLTIYGFTEPGIFVFDITDPNRPVFNGATASGGAHGNYSISFMSAAGARYLAVTAGAAATKLNAWADARSRLTDKQNRADWLIIAPDTLISAARSLATYRQSRGLETMVIDLEDIMDEFNYGISSPEAIRDFLRYAYYNWKKAPRYVVLAGDGTYDYRDNMGAGDNLVPTLMTETPQMLSPSDNLIADVDGDHVPDIAIGRLPVLTAEELQGVIGKIIAYEKTAGNRIVMLADNQDDGGNFPADSNDIAALLPSGYSVKKIYLSDYALDSARQTLIDSINNGVMLLNYIGHAGLDRLANEGLLLSSDIASLQNSGRPFVLAAMTCTVGNFALPGYDALGEALVTRNNGGAVAVWAPTGLSFNFMAKVLNENLFRGVFENTETALGDAILEAMSHYHETGNPVYIMDIFNLQGDPALQMW